MVKQMRITTWIGAGLALTGSITFGDTPALTPTSPPSLSVNISGGEVKLPSGGSVKVAPAKLTLDAPEIRVFATERDKDNQLPQAPANYAPYIDGWDPWPGGANPVGLTPRYDEAGTLILGGFFRYFRSETIEVMSEDGTKKYQKDIDFKLNPDWGQIVNIDGHMTGRVQAKGEAALPRLDLVEVGADCKVSIKKGTTAYVCPVLPDADPGDVALAGIYIAPWRAKSNPFYDGTGGSPKGTTEYAVTKHEICAIHPVEPIAPIHPEKVAGTLAKLRAGQPVKIAFMGASVSAGAEAPVWYAKKPYTAEDHTFRGRFVYGLQQRFPKAQITPIEAFKGATTVDYAMEQLPGVLAQKPDLVLVDFGVNDLSGPVGGLPKKPLADYEKDMESLVKQIRASGAEVIVIAPGVINPWLKNHAGERQPEYCKAAIEAATKQDAAAANPMAEFNQLGAHGIPPWSQIHNWINHPGDLGHLVYAENLLLFFPGDSAAATNPLTDPAAAPSNDDGIVFGIAQPDAVKGTWEADKQDLLPIEEIVQQPAPDRPVYGVYCWADEYVRFHDFIKQVGWTTCRLGGDMSDAAMKLCAQDNMEVFECLSGQGGVGLPADIPTGNRAKFDSDDAFIAGYQKKLAAWLERWGPGGTFFKDNPDVPNNPVKYIEVWNEPNFFYLDQPQWMPAKDTAEMLAWNDKREKLYGKLLVAAYQTIKAKWPGVSVLGFGAGGAAHADVHFIESVHEDNPAVAHSYDILSTHPYDNSAPPELTAVAPWGKWSMADSAQEIRAIMTKFGTADKPIWYSELNWEISSAEGGRYAENAMHPSPESKNTQAMQAAYIVRGYAWTMRIGVKRLTYMSLVDTDNCNSGLMNSDGTWRISAHAVKTMIDLMPRPALRGAVSDGDDSTFIYRFNPDYNVSTSPDVIMAWRATGPKTVEIPWPNAQVDLVDMTGARQTFPVTNGKVKLHIGPCPIYLVTTKS
jgi:lysophospholipase L1-like esterase